jgi:glutaminase
MLDHRGSPRTALRRRYSGADVRSKRVRRAGVARFLDELAGAIAVFELQGDLFFANTEPVVRLALGDPPPRHVIVDATRVTSIDPIAASLLRGLGEALAGAGTAVLFVGLKGDTRAALELDDAALARDIDHALERCEDALLTRAGSGASGSTTPVRLSDFDLLGDFDAAELVALERRMTPRRYAAGETIIRDGAIADALYFLLDGAVDVRLPIGPAGDHVRLGTVEAGNVVGELALLGSPRRTADVVATAPVTALELTTDGFEALGRAHPAIQSKLLIAVGRSLSERLRRANAEIRALTG